MSDNLPAIDENTLSADNSFDKCRRQKADSAVALSEAIDELQAAAAELAATEAAYDLAKVAHSRARYRFEVRVDNQTTTKEENDVRASDGSRRRHGLAGGRCE